LPTLLAKFPELRGEVGAAPEPRVSVLGRQLSTTEIRQGLSAGSAGAIGTALAAAAALGFDSSILGGARASLPAPRSQPGARGVAVPRGARRELELVGDLGEAFVHEWLSLMLQADYGPECWVSQARERYGYPASGNDNLGCDFKVPDLFGRLFGQPAQLFHLEVKSTSTDGGGPFPMSRPEWDEAARCHHDGEGAIYVIVRVFNVMARPYIGDVIVDPVAAEIRGELRITERDLWVKIAPLVQ
jgi:hypothetical protein